MTEKIILRLSGEHPTLPEIEAKRLFASIDPKSRMTKGDGRLLLVETSLCTTMVEETCGRLALTLEASRVLALTDKEIQDAQLPPNLFDELRNRTFIVRAKGYGRQGPQVERELGARILAKARGLHVKTSVSVNNPVVVLIASRMKANEALSILIPTPPRSSFRIRAESKPFKQPISIDPIIARAMINISGVLRGEKLLDPFCGTGTILLEAGIVGAEIYGMDFDTTMVEGTKRNLAKLQTANPRLVRGDALKASDLFGTNFDHIVTDPPYGRASPRMSDPDGLLERIPRVCRNLLRSGGTACVASPSTMDLSKAFENEGLVVEEFAYQRIHGSLGRHLYLAIKPQGPEDRLVRDG